jgi:hypothetical protein
MYACSLLAATHEGAISEKMNQAAGFSTRETHDPDLGSGALKDRNPPSPVKPRGGLGLLRLRFGPRIRPGRLVRLDDVLESGQVLGNGLGVALELGVGHAGKAAQAEYHFTAAAVLSDSHRVINDFT